MSVPGAFTPTCQNTHLPGFLEKKDALKAKGVSQVLVIAFNDPFVMSAWGKANGCKDDFFVSFPNRLRCSLSPFFVPRQDVVLFAARASSHA